MNNKGQSVLSEHVMVFFVVVAALVAMTTYAQRAFEARIDGAAIGGPPAHIARALV